MPGSTLSLSTSLPQSLWIVIRKWKKSFLVVSRLWYVPPSSSLLFLHRSPHFPCIVQCCQCFTWLLFMYFSLCSSEFSVLDIIKVVTMSSRPLWLPFFCETKMSGFCFVDFFLTKESFQHFICFHARVRTPLIWLNVEVRLNFIDFFSLLCSRHSTSLAGKKVMGKQSLTHSKAYTQFVHFCIHTSPMQKRNASSQSFRVLWLNLMGAGKYNHPLKEWKLASKDCHRMLVVCVGKILDRLL